MGLQTLIVSIGSYTKTSNGAGGGLETWPLTLKGLTCLGNYPSPSNYTFRAGGVGEIERTSKVFVFDTAAGDTLPTSLKLKDKILTADGSVWNVLNVRSYDDQIQADCEAGD